MGRNGQSNTALIVPPYRGATAATDETLLVCRLADGTKVGAVQLIHGNGPDVVGDYHDTPAMEALMAKANAYAENA